MPAAGACAFCYGSDKAIPLRAENFAAFRASTLDDIAAVCRLHALTEPVNLAPLTLLGLEGTYHPNTPRFISRIPQTLCLR
ncbi:hypothetical protein SDC9_88634 [bioreactor metagenome]|uniref:Uncharacterized protein n=1 Tax=bioreactor metagenome TaxID=1076179 RepID=A0A644ZMC1_9ZZZZ